MAEPHTYPDPEVLVADLLADAMADETVTVDIGVPTGWGPASTPHLQVALDGTPRLDHPIAVYSTIRVVARAGLSSEAKRLATLSLALLCAHPGDATVPRIRPLTGPLPARDPETRADIASITVQVTVRSTPVPV